MTFRQQLGLFLTMFFAYLVLQSREIPWNDGKRIHQVAESIVARGAVDVSPPGIEHNGKTYAVNPLVPSAIHVPGAFLHVRLRQVWPTADYVLKAMTSHIGPAALGALACLLFALLCRDLGVSALGCRLAVLVLGFATMLAVYARSPWSEMAQTTAFLGFFLWLLRLHRNATPWAALWLGLWAGVLVNTKVVYALCIPGAALFAGVQLYRKQGARPLLRALGLALLGGLPGLVTMLAYNHARTGSLFDVGYALSAPGQQSRSFSENPFYGLWGLLLSPGKSLFLYSPPLIVALLALPHALRTRDRGWLWALLLTGGPVVYSNAKYLFWSGDWCWGPRYILFVVPALLLPAIFVFDDLLARRRRLALAAGGAVFAVGLFVQVLGSLFYWDHFIRISQEARTSWLGAPNRAGAAAKDRGGMCDPCFEDFYPFNWLPAFSPVEGHYWLLRHVPRRHSWEQAEADAPWHRYTSLKLRIASSYPRARLDWWFLDWKKDLRPAGAFLLAFMFAGALGSAFLWWRVGSPSAPDISQHALAGPGMRT